MPGVRPEDVTVDLQGKDLRIGGEYGTAQQQSEDSDQQGTRRTGRFDYRITLPGEVTSESCTADLDHGVLRLRLPKVSQGTRQRIPVQAGRADQLGSGSPAEAGKATEATRGASASGREKQ